MKKNIYLTILTIVTVACIIFGSLYHIIGLSSQISEYISLPFLKEKESESNSMNTDALTLEAFTGIKGDFSVIDLTISPGSSYKISYNGNKKFAPEYSVTDGVLNIKQQKVGIKSFGIKNNKCELTVTIPADTSLSSVELTSDVGDIDLNNLAIGQLNLSADVGDLELKKLSSDEIVIETNVGDVDVKDCTYETIKITSDVGDISIDGQEELDSYAFDLSTDLGTVKVDGKKHSRSYEKTKEEGNNRLIYVRNDTGDISIDD